MNVLFSFLSLHMIFKPFRVVFQSRTNDFVQVISYYLVDIVSEMEFTLFSGGLTDVYTNIIHWHYVQRSKI